MCAGDYIGDNGKGKYRWQSPASPLSWRWWLWIRWWRCWRCWLFWQIVLQSLRHWDTIELLSQVPKSNSRLCVLHLYFTAVRCISKQFFYHVSNLRTILCNFVFFIISWAWGRRKRRRTLVTFVLVGIELLSHSGKDQSISEDFPILWFNSKKTFWF